MTVLAPHRLLTSAFDEIAAGFGDGPAIGALVRGQLSRRKALLLSLARELDELPVGADTRRRFTAACDLLGRLEAEAPDAVTGRDGALRHPYLEVWGVDTLRVLRQRRGDAGRPDLDARLGYLTGVATVAALRAGAAVELDVVLPSRGLPLPGLGRTEPAGPGGARLRTDGATLTVVSDGGRSLGIVPARLLRDAPHPVRLEDTDPYRDTFGQPVAEPTDDAGATTWRTTLRQAWELIGTEHPAYLPGLTAGLLSVTPLAPTADSDASAAARRAFGAIATVLPPTPARLAVLLIHEFQHVKLGALEDLVTLFDASDTRLHYAPWRPDPRPLPNLVQGTYAHLGVTDFWRVHRHSAGTDAAFATRQFARWRTQTARAIDVIAASPALTDEGRRFTAAMAATMAPWLEEPVPAADSRAAEQAARRHREQWESARRSASAGP